MFPEPTSPTSSGSPGSAQRNTRYAYLVGRLRSRQMTMEEATELFGIMDGMLRASEAARASLMRTTAVAPVPTEAGSRPARPTPPSGGGASDDFFLLGILAMGAGAGLLAAMARRLQDLPPISPNQAAPGQPTTKPKPP